MLCSTSCDFLESIHSCVMCMNIEIASVMFEIGNIPEPATTPGPRLLWPMTTLRSINQAFNQ